MLKFINLVCKYFNHAKADKDIFDDLIDAECHTENAILLALALGGGNEDCSPYFTNSSLITEEGSFDF